MYKLIHVEYSILYYIYIYFFLLRTLWLATDYSPKREASWVAHAALVSSWVWTHCEEQSQSHLSTSKQHKQVCPDPKHSHLMIHDDDNQFSTSEARTSGSSGKDFVQGSLEETWLTWIPTACHPTAIQLPHIREATPASRDPKAMVAAPWPQFTFS